ncbi:MAG TPA: hypothetical protein DEQ87_16255 [Algoriphagus sp.]|jgi:hypothetical protein|uniref:Uncharacterized protein n=1 Tax=Aquiflexum balticum DSM 16537 TaxID=758820 RepID=A0A1W2H843_9BACT|nr:MULTISPECIES: hypothetical protein [Cyclobacteriaceae]MAL14150.1 hypothetical protein [Algoriphagus sp.]MAN88388.1 hypothetical protein [Algoriphagus sp.]SMD44746.1 hypothetical protein SAMN00777080_3375 [Aquiflexum balticum DSM 16537]HAD52424.1 hypothetical protein [Algoriphagus sp.]HAZ23331.1 hypothetical protein [Algoriphagus sp.]|tara:strand:- start:59 stop:250 length:192 start_codon:yes stop_codon:yes gene_type:complete
MNWLQYSKEILRKVSFDSQLLKKEFKKALRMLNRKDGISLKRWFKEKFGKTHDASIDRKNQLP